MKKNEQQLGAILKLLFRDDKSQSMYFQTKIEMEWRKKMGVTINRYTQDIVLKNRILYIKITSSSLKQELLFSKDQIVEFANNAIGEKDFVTQVILM
jgi:hypothetical protein